ncbi:hypothetical protein SapgrDRAFT_2303 [Saprospira grandis DSM 2844]|uniref:DUF262 domain-containing protein n=1 Tax=Saprospira grandis DSM 2844 TaxID=694433 RepID=J0XXY3_9BACT|nr:DUF262 domain-containing protein [Saprospira grandis]EJF53971.1 hypothetical protein SapgrDRAFT_2303 [Saprospira grandis DSM 2844]
MGQLLYTIKEVFQKEGYLSAFKKVDYYIPLYQRGYKWTSKQVDKLLDDIHRFEPEGAKFYCLQNITLVPEGTCFNVVDGQQRLTTLVLLLSYLGDKNLVKDKLRFPKHSIRRYTNDFLKEIVTKEESVFPNSSWEDFILTRQYYDRQDIYHLFGAYKAIESWFEKKKLSNNKDKSKFSDKILNHVKIIINKIDKEGNISEEKIFGNLNSKRVPLDGADLVRAIIITRVAKEEGEREGDIKNIVRVNEKRVKIGWQLDQINNWWSREEVKNYFTQFISIKSEEAGIGNKLFKENKYPINLLYLLFAEKQGESELTLELIERYNNNAIALYKELLELNNSLKDWFEDRGLYHYLGFLFFNDNRPKNKGGISFYKIWEIWKSSKTRSTFKILLKKKMRRLIKKDEGALDFTNMEINWYDDKDKTSVKILVLMDVIHCSQFEGQAFLPHTAFTKANNDIEHIFPQNPAEINKKKDYIHFLNTHIVPKEKQFDLANFDSKKEDEKYLLNVDNFIEEHISAIKINSIGNLVLLYSSLNRSLGNKAYTYKRARVVEYFNKGHFIQPHTFKVFVRYFNNELHENKDLDYWTNQDIEANAIKITQTIQNFFKTETDDQ